MLGRQEVGDGNGLVTARTASPWADPATPGVALRASLVFEIARSAVVALVNRVGSFDHRQNRCLHPSPVCALAAGVRAVLGSARSGEHGRAESTAQRPEE